MRHLKLFGIALIALCALGIGTATSAFALPEVAISLGGAYPINLVVTVLVNTSLSNVSGEKLTGKKLLLLLLLLAAGHLGTFEALFQEVKNEKSGNSCDSEESGKADKTGEVLTKGTWHLVYTSLSPLRLGILFLVSPVTIKCGTEEISTKGLVLSSVNQAKLGESEATEYESLGGILKGNGAGKPSLTVYYNEAGTAAKAKLEANFGSGFKESAEEAAEEVSPKAEGGKMFTITSR
jgi:hypothetical protein